MTDPLNVFPAYLRKINNLENVVARSTDRIDGCMHIYIPLFLPQ